MALQRRIYFFETRVLNYSPQFSSQIPIQFSNWIVSIIHTIAQNKCNSYQRIAAPINTKKQNENKREKTKDYFTLAFVDVEQRMQRKILNV